MINDLLDNQSLKLFGAIMAVAVTDEWRQAHPATFWVAWDRLTSNPHTVGLTKPLDANGMIPSDAVVVDMMTVLTGIAEADPRLALWSMDDLAWLTSALAGEYRSFVLTLLSFYARVPSSDYLTPVEAEEVTGVVAATWRKRAGHGLVPGAVKKGKQWLLPRAVALAMS